MSDNITRNPTFGGDVVGADEIGSVKFPRVKLIHGADGTNDGDVSSSNPLPTRVPSIVPVFITNLGISGYDVKTSPGILFGASSFSVSVTGTRIWFFNKPASGVVIGTDLPILHYLQEGKGSLDGKSSIIVLEFPIAFSVALSAFATNINGLAPENSIPLNVFYA